jgi:hypothetical protein
MNSRSQPVGQINSRLLGGGRCCRHAVASRNWTPKIADAPSRSNDLWDSRVRVGSRKLFHFKRPAAAVLALDSGHRASRRGPATSPRTRPR